MRRKAGLWLMLCLCAVLALSFAEEAAPEPEELFGGETPEGDAFPGEEIPEEDAAPTVAPPERIILLKRGSSGEEVRILQLRLLELGYLEGEADGIYGPATQEAVRDFQRRNSLSVDGAAGKQTQECLYSAEAVPVPPPADPVDVLSDEWPLLVNLEHPVDVDFLPADLVSLTDACDPELVKIKYESIRGVREAVDALVRMLEGARADGVTRWQVSAGYRSLADQERMLENRIRTNLKNHPDWSRSRARRSALRTVAEPGASEHHLGLSFDVNVPGASAFAGTKQCKWLHAHCWEYGFIVRYQEGKEAVTGFAPEAWHIRYVRTEHSLIMRDEGLCLEEYLEKYHPGA